MGKHPITKGSQFVSCGRNPLFSLQGIYSLHTVGEPKIFFCLSSKDHPHSILYWIFSFTCTQNREATTNVTGVTMSGKFYSKKIHSKWEQSHTDHILKRIQPQSKLTGLFSMKSQNIKKRIKSIPECTAT